MKWRSICVAIVITIIGGQLAHAQEGLGVGIILGEPTGISLKVWISEKQAIDAAAAWSFSENDSFQFHADYLVHYFYPVKSEGFQGKLPLYAGVGGRLKLEEDNDGKGRNDDDSLLGVRIPFGISYVFADFPIDLFVEIVPVLDVIPDTEFDINAAVGARFYIH